MALAALTLYAGYGVLSFDYRGIDHILYGLAPHDFACGLLLIVLLFEATRRSVAWAMVAVGALFILYNAYGNLLPDVVANRGFSFERIVRFQVFSGAGLFGTPLGIAAGTVFMFVLFGAFLEVTGAGRFFIDLAFAGAGRYRGGPAKASVLASAAMGSISGSAIANTVTTGALTIPMMKKLGYKPEQAAGIEAAASTGGQIMPPIMGAGAFIMAEFTATPYNSIVVLSIAPAVLYFFCTLVFVHLGMWSIGIILALIIVVAIAAEGYALKPTTGYERLALALSAALLIYADDRNRILGLVVAGLAMTAHAVRVRRA